MYVTNVELRDIKPAWTTVGGAAASMLLKILPFGRSGHLLLETDQVPGDGSS